MEDPLIRVPALQSGQEPKPNIRLDLVGEVPMSVYSSDAK